MASIHEFLGKISQHKGLQDRNRYRIILPNLHIGDDVIAMDAFCRQVSFPGKTLNTFARRVNMKEEKRPGGYSVDPVNMNFNETQDNLVGRYFDFWLNTIVNPYDYLVEYRDFYARNIFIMKMDRQDRITYGVLLKKAYPVSKLLVDYSDTSMSTFMEQPVSFEYEDYEVVDHSLTGALNQVIARTRASILSVPLSNAITLGRAVANVL